MTSTLDLVIPVVNVADEKNMDVFHNLPSIEVNLPKEVKMALIYVAGYVVRKDQVTDDSFIYSQEYGKYTEELNRGGLTLNRR